MKALLELAERCENATGADWLLSRDIFKATGGLPKVWMGSKVISWFGNGPYGCNTEDGKRHLDCLNAPSYTGSVDTAMMLVLPADEWECGTAKLVNRAWASVVSPDHETKGKAATAALALCAAALRARSLAAGEEQR